MKSVTDGLINEQFKSYLDMCYKNKGINIGGYRGEYSGGYRGEYSGGIQFIEIRRAFYAGAASGSGLVVSAVNEKNTDKIISIANEYMLFADLVDKGVA